MEVTRIRNILWIKLGQFGGQSGFHEVITLQIIVKGYLESSKLSLSILIRVRSFLREKGIQRGGISWSYVGDCTKSIVREGSRLKFQIWTKSSTRKEHFYDNSHIVV